MSMSEDNSSESPKPRHNAYQKGDIVWTKLGSSWWPGEVKNHEELPSDLNSDFKKPPLVIVKFFDEDSYEYVKNWSHIYPYNCDRKVDFIKKGMAAFRSRASHMEKFPKDVTKAEERTGGNPNILSEPVFLPPKKFNYSDLFGTSSPNPKKPKSTSSTRKSYNKTPRLVTHRRFLGHDDYKAFICIQYPGKFRLSADDESEAPVEEDEGRTIECKSCGFSTKRFSVMMIHAKMHLNSAQKKKIKSPRKRKDVRKKDIFSDLLEEWSDDDRDEAKENNTVSKGKAKAIPTSVKKPTRTYSKKSKKKYLEEKSWEDSDLADFLKKDKSKDKSGESSDLSKLSSNTQEDIKNCFDFDEEEEDEDIIVSTAPGRKIPRVIPEKTKSPRTEELQHTLEDDTDINKDEILKTSQSFNKSGDEKSTDNLEDIFKEVMEEIVIPQVDRLLNDLKPEQNFHDGRTVKKPDKCGPSETDAGRLASPKKRFVKSFEDFEMEIHSQRTVLENIDQTLAEAEPQNIPDAIQESTTVVVTHMQDKGPNADGGEIEIQKLSGESKNMLNIEPLAEKSVEIEQQEATKLKSKTTFNNEPQTEKDSSMDTELEISSDTNKNTRNSKYQYTEFNIDMPERERDKKPVGRPRKKKASDENIAVQNQSVENLVLDAEEKTSKRTSGGRKHLAEKLKPSHSYHDTEEQSRDINTPTQEKLEIADESDSDIEISLKVVENPSPRSARLKKINISKEKHITGERMQPMDAVIMEQKSSLEDKSNRRTTRYSEKQPESESSSTEKKASGEAMKKKDTQPEVQSKDSEQSADNMKEKYTRRKTRHTQSAEKDDQAVKQLENQTEIGPQIDFQDQKILEEKPLVQKETTSKTEENISRRRTRHSEKELPTEQVEEPIGVNNTVPVQNQSTVVEEDVSRTKEKKLTRQSKNSGKDSITEPVSEKVEENISVVPQPIDEIPQETGEIALDSEHKKTRHQTRHSERESVVKPSSKEVGGNDIISQSTNDKSPELLEHAEGEQHMKTRRQTRHSEKQSVIEQTSEKPKEQHVEDKSRIEEKKASQIEETKSRRQTRHSEKELENKLITEEKKEKLSEKEPVFEQSGGNDAQMNVVSEAISSITADEQTVPNPEEKSSRRDTKQAGRKTYKEPKVYHYITQPIEEISSIVIEETSPKSEEKLKRQKRHSEKKMNEEVMVVPQYIDDKVQTTTEEKVPKTEEKQFKRQTRQSEKEVFIEQGNDKLQEVVLQTSENNARVSSEEGTKEIGELLARTTAVIEDQVTMKDDAETVVSHSSVPVSQVLIKEIVSTADQECLERGSENMPESTSQAPLGENLKANMVEDHPESSSSAPDLITQTHVQKATVNEFRNEDTPKTSEQLPVSDEVKNTSDMKSPKRGRGRPRLSDQHHLISASSTEAESVENLNSADTRSLPVAEAELKSLKRGRGRPKLSDGHHSTIKTQQFEVDGSKESNQIVESHQQKAGEQNLIKTSEENESNPLTQGNIETPIQKVGESLPLVQGQLETKPNQPTHTTCQQQLSKVDVPQSLQTHSRHQPESNILFLAEELKKDEDLISMKSVARRGRGRPSKHLERLMYESESGLSKSEDQSFNDAQPLPTHVVDTETATETLDKPPKSVDKSPKRARGRPKLSEQHQTYAKLESEFDEVQQSAAFNEEPTDVSKHSELVNDEHLNISSQNKDNKASRRESSSESKKKKVKKEEPKVELNVSLRERRTRTTYSEEDKILQKVLKESAEEAKRLEAKKAKETEEVENKKDQRVRDKPESRELRRRTTKVSEEDRILEKVLRESAEEARLLAEQKAKENATSDVHREVDLEPIDANHQKHKESTSVPKKKERRSRWDSGPLSRPPSSPEKAKEITLGVVIDTKQSTSKAKLGNDSNKECQLAIESMKNTESFITDKLKLAVEKSFIEKQDNLDSITDEKNHEKNDSKSAEELADQEGDLITKMSVVEESENLHTQDSIEEKVVTSAVDEVPVEKEVVLSENSSRPIAIEKQEATSEKSNEELAFEKGAILFSKLSENSTKSLALQKQESGLEKSNDILAEAHQPNIEVQSSVLDFSFDISEIPLPPGDPKSSQENVVENICQIPLEAIPLPSDPLPKVGSNVLVSDSTEKKSHLEVQVDNSEESVLPKKGRWSRRNSHPKKDRKDIEQVSPKDIKIGDSGDQKAEEKFKYDVFLNTSSDDSEIILPIKKSRRITESNIMLDDDFSFKEDDTPPLLQKNINDALNFIIEDTATPPKKSNQSNQSDLWKNLEEMIIDNSNSSEVPASEETIKKSNELQKGVPPKKKKVDLLLEDEKEPAPALKQEIPQPPKKKLQKLYEMSEKSWTSEMPLMSPLAKKKSFAFQEEQCVVNQACILENTQVTLASSSKAEILKKQDLEDGLSCEKSKLIKSDDPVQNQNIEATRPDENSEKITAFVAAAERPDVNSECLSKNEQVATVVTATEIVPSTAKVEELVLEEGRVEVSQENAEEIIPRESVIEQIVTEISKVDALETSIKAVIPQEGKIEKIEEPQTFNDSALNTNVQQVEVEVATSEIMSEPILLKNESKNFMTPPPSKSTPALDSKIKNASEPPEVAKQKELTDNVDESVVGSVVDVAGDKNGKLVSSEAKELHITPSKDKLIKLAKSKPDTVRGLVKEKIITKVTEQEKINAPSTSKLSKLPLKSKPEIVGKEKLVLKVGSAKFSKDMKPIASLKPESKKIMKDDEPSRKLEEHHVVMGTKPDVIPDPPIAAEMVEIEENLIQTISQKELADAQVTITPDQVISEKKPTGVTNLLNMADFSESSNSSIELPDKKPERGTEFSSNAMTKPLDSKIPISRSSTYGRLELLDILEGNSNSNSSTSSNEQFRKSFHKHEPAFIEGIQDFEECIPSSAIVLSKKLVLQQAEAPQTILESPKLLERLSQPQQKVVIQSDIKVKDSDKIVKVTTKPPLMQTKPRIVIKSKPTGITTAKSPSSKPIILSEQIIRPATLPSLVTNSNQATVSALKRPFEDIEDVEKPFIISKLARTESPDAPEEEVKEVKPRKPRGGKAKILQHSIINPQGTLVPPKPVSTHLQALSKPHTAITQPQTTISQPKSIKTATGTAQSEDVMFDINSMPIVLSDELLTPESIEKMPVVISNDIISTTGSSSLQSTAKTSTVLAKEKAAPNLLAKKPVFKVGMVAAKVNMGSTTAPTPTTPSEKPKSRVLGSTAAASSKLPVAAGLLTTPGSKSAKYLLVSATAQPQPKILVGKPASAIPSLQVSKPAQPAVTTDTTNGSKIMIVTNQQGEAHRLLLTPAQQKMLGMQGQPVKDTKTVVKGPIPKGLLAETVPGPSGLAPLSPTIGTQQQKVLGTLVTTQTVSGVARSGIAVPVPRSPRLVPHKRYQGKPGKQKTILIKNQLGQTVKKIQGTDDDELDRQVAEQLAAIKASAMLQAQQAVHESVVPRNTPPTTTPSVKMAAKPAPKRTPPKKIELVKSKLSQPVGGLQTQPQLAQKVMEGISSGTGPQKMAAAQPLLKKSLETKVVREEKPTTTIQQPAATTQPTLAKAEASSQPTNLSTKVGPAGESKKPDRPLQQLVIQDALGNQTTITEGQILALPSETVDGQPQSYMLITLDESGNLTPLNNEALMSLDPSLGLGGDISNMVLQVDQGQGILAAASAVANKSDIAAAPIITDQQKVAERIKGPVIEPKELNGPHTSESAQKPPLKSSEATKPVQKPQITPEGVQKSLETEQKLPDESLTQQSHAESLMATPLETHSMLPELYVSLGDPPNGDPTQGQQLIVTGDPIITQKFLESLTDGSTDLASILTNADGGSLLIQIDGQQILIRTNAAPPLIPSESNEGNGNPIFSPQHKPNQDILAAALANTDVFQGQDSPTSVINKEGLLPPGSELSPNSAGGTLYPMHVSNVLETSLTLSSPIMTPLEAPSLPNKKIADEVDILSQVPKNVDLPITITDPNISQTVAHPPASLVELTLPLSDAPCISTATQIIESTRSPSFSYALTQREDIRPSKSSENTTDGAQKCFNANMPLLTEDLNEETVEKKEEVRSFKVVGDEKSGGEDLEMTETTTSSTDSLLEAGLCTLGGAMCSSLSEPPPDMFELPLVSEKEEEIASDQSNSVPEAETLSLNSDGSGEIPLQPRIVAELSEIKRLGEDSDSGDTFGAKRAKYD